MNRPSARSIGPITGRRSVIAGVAVAVVLAVLTGCGSGAADTGHQGSRGLSIVASTDVYGDLAEVVAGHHADVTSIIDDPGVDPHAYEASTRDLLSVSRADIIIVNGGGYDPFMQTLRDGADDPDAEVLDVVSISGKRARAGGELNEHVWYDFATVARLTDRLRDALVGRDPSHAADYRANAGRLIGQLAALEARARQIGAAHRGASAVVTEPVPAYLLDAVGLKDRTPDAFAEAVEAGEAASPAVLADTLALFTDDPVDVVVSNAQTTDDQTRQIADAAHTHGIPVVSVTETLPEGESYVTWMRANLDALAHALDGRARHPAVSGR